MGISKIFQHKIRAHLGSQLKFRLLRFLVQVSLKLGAFYLVKF